MVKKLPANAGHITDAGSIAGSRISARGGNGNPLQCSCLENPMNRGVWRATVHGVAKELDTTERHVIDENSSSSIWPKMRREYLFKCYLYEKGLKTL